MDIREKRAVGCIVGGAIGDALGAAQEIFPKSRDLQHTIQQVLQQRQRRKANGLQVDFEEGGPWSPMLVLKKGQWTDDTSMMLCLADSILQRQAIDVPDLMQKFQSWISESYNTCLGFPIGLGRNTELALCRYRPEDPGVLTGGTNPDRDAGNGAIMRLSPVPVYWAGDLGAALEAARLQSATTHNVPEALDACALMTFAIWHAINGKGKSGVLDALPECPGLTHDGIRELASENAKWRTAQEQDVITLPGRCLWTLEAALWCIANTDNFKDALITAVNLGGDADTVGSVTGQIAGALYGIDSIPTAWLEGLEHRNSILNRAVALYQHLPYDESSMKLEYSDEVLEAMRNYK